jgi:hypothetical protein
MLLGPPTLASAPPSSATIDNVQLKLTPRVCAIGATEKNCEAKVLAEWQAPHNESLCLYIADRPQVKRCWEDYAQGSYRIELTFDRDVVFELRDARDNDLLAAETLKLIRQALEYRRRRRAPWNVFE